MRGEESFEPKLRGCMKNTLEAMNAGDHVLPTTDCIHEKSYSLIKYTCGQHPNCRNRFDVDPDKRSKLLEFTKRRML